jgi:hypothetical protein
MLDPADFKWMSAGGILLDGSGDIALTAPGSLEGLVSIVRTRLKAGPSSWKLYSAGANLLARLGDTVDQELEIVLRRQTLDALRDLLPTSAVDVETMVMPEGSRILVLVYLNQNLIATADLTTQPQFQLRVS